MTRPKFPFWYSHGRFVLLDGDVAAIAIGNDAMVIPDEGKLAVVAVGDRKDSKACADARLMAAAPVMFDTLRRILREHDTAQKARKLTSNRYESIYAARQIVNELEKAP